MKGEKAVITLDYGIEIHKVKGIIEEPAYFSPRPRIFSLRPDYISLPITETVLSVVVIRSTRLSIVGKD